MIRLCILLLLSSTLAAAVEFSADGGVEWDRDNRTYRATGGASAQVEGWQVSAQTLTATYDQITDNKPRFTLITATRQIKANNPARGITLTANTASLTPDARRIEADGTVHIQTQALDARTDHVTLQESPARTHIIRMRGNVRLRTPQGQTATGTSLIIDEQQQTALLTGNVRLDDGTTTLETQRLRLNLIRQANRWQIDSVTAEETMRLHHHDQTITATTATWHPDSGEGTATGAVTLHQPDTLITGSHLQFNSVAGTATLAATDTGRVTARYTITTPD